MKLKRLVLSNFCAYKKLDIPLDNNGLTLIKGNTGSGKSTIFSAIIYALFDKSDKGVNISELTNWHYPNKPSKISLYIEDDKGTQYRIKKIISEKGNTTKVFGGERTEAQKHWRSTEYKEKIRQIVGIDYETFVNSLYIKQGHMTELVTGTNADRNKLFSKFQDIPVLEKARQLQSEDFRDVVDKLDDVRDKIQRNKRDLKQLKPGSLAQKKEQLKLKKDSILQKIEKTINQSFEVKKIVERMESDSSEFYRIKGELDKVSTDILTSDKRMKSLIWEIANCQERLPLLIEAAAENSSSVLKINDELEVIKQQKKSIPALEKEINLIDNQIYEYKNQLSDLNSKRSILLRDKEELIKAKRKIEKSNKCNECGQSISESHKDTILIALELNISKNEQSLISVNKEIGDINISISALEQDLKKTEDDLQAINQSNRENELKLNKHKLELDREQIDNKVKDLEDTIDRDRTHVQTLEESIKEKQKQKKDLKYQLNCVHIGKDEQVLQKARSKHYEILEKLTKLKEAEGNVNAESLTVEFELGKCDKIRKRLGKLEEIERNLSEEIKYQEVFSEILSKNGLRVHKIESMLQTINSYISNYQSHFADSKIMSVEFGVDINGKIDLYIWIKGVSEPKSIKSLSGGEREMVAFPVTLAVFSYIAGRNYSNVLFIDEGLVYLDEERKSYVADILNEIKERGTNIFIVSHDSFIQDFSYDQIWTVENKGKHSELRMN